jgi:hypothetical protein
MRENADRSVFSFVIAISTDASVSPSVIVQIDVNNMQIRAISYATAWENQLGGAKIVDGKRIHLRSLPD